MKKQWLSIMTMVCVLSTSMPFPSVAYNKNHIDYGKNEIVTESDTILYEEGFDEMTEENERATESDARQKNKIETQNSQNTNKKLIATITDEKDFEIDEDGVLKKYNGSGENVVIPDGVTCIGTNAFSGCDSLTSVVIPDSVITIKDWAFHRCSNLSSIEISNNVTTIQSGAFSECSSLTNVKIPDSLTEIAYQLFYNCSSLTNIEIPNSVTGIRQDAFNGCTSLTSIEIPNSVTHLGLYAFKGCSNLADIKLPDNLIYFDSGVFWNCTSITSIKIPDSLKSMGSQGFQGCSSLTRIEIPRTLTSIGYMAFYMCDNLTIYGESGSYAEEYAKKNNIPFVYKPADGKEKLNITAMTPEKGETTLYNYLKDASIEDKKDFPLMIYLNGEYSVSNDAILVLKNYSDGREMLAFKTITTKYEEENKETIIELIASPDLPEDTKLYPALKQGSIINMDNGISYTVLCNKEDWWFRTPKLLKNIWGFKNYTGQIDYEVYKQVFPPVQAVIFFELRNGERGLCAGMVGSVADFARGTIKYTDFIQNSKIEKLEDLTENAVSKKINMDVDAYIKFSHILQNLPSVTEQKKNNRCKKTEKLKDLYDAIIKNKNICISLRKNILTNHAVWAYAIETEKDYSDILVYDCNTGSNIPGKIRLYGSYPNFNKWECLQMDSYNDSISFVEYPSPYEFIQASIPYQKGILLAISLDDFEVEDTSGNTVSSAQADSTKQDIITPIVNESTFNTKDCENEMYWLKPDSTVKAENTSQEPKAFTIALDTQMFEMNIPSSDIVEVTNTSNQMMDIQIEDHGDSELTASYGYVIDDEIVTIQFTGYADDIVTINGKEDNADIHGIDITKIKASYLGDEVEKTLNIPTDSKINISVEVTEDDKYLKVMYDANHDGNCNTDFVDPIPFNPSEDKPENIPVTSMDIKFVEKEINVGDTVQLIADIKPENATNKTVIWSSSDESVVTISDSGLITALKAGTVNITIKLNDGSIEKSITITVQDKDKPIQPEDGGSTEPKPDDCGTPGLKPDDSGTSEANPDKNKPNTDNNDTSSDNTGTNTGSSHGGGGSSGRSRTSGGSQVISIPATPGYWVLDNLGWKFMNLDGGIYTNTWIYVNNCWYRINPEGYMLESWAFIDDHWYYFMPISGEMKTGWIIDKVDWYYLDENGVMKTGWIFVNGGWYYLGVDGRLLLNTITPDGYQVDGNGKWIN